MKNLIKVFHSSLFIVFCLSSNSFAQSQVDITSLDGIISAKYLDSPGGEGIDKLFDKNPQTKYLIFHDEGWVQFQAPNSYIVTKYAIVCANDSPERDPKDWTFEGSNDTITWNPLDHQYNQSFSSRLERKEFVLKNNIGYLYYRLEIKNHSGTILQFSEWKLTVCLKMENQISMISGSLAAV